MAIRFARIRSGKMPLPDTRMSAPASAVIAAVSTLIPPSTWISVARPSLSTYRRASWIFGTTSARNACPENPGWTVMMRSRSTSLRNGRAFSNGVAGFRTTPGRIPASRIFRRVARTSWSLSTWTVRSSTPASAKACTKSCGCVTIKWASKGTLVSARIDLTIAGPIVRLGTKWPSITSMWSMSAPASAASRTWSPKRSNRADKIDGAILMAIGLRNERAWNKISLPQGLRRREGTRYSARLGSMDRRVARHVPSLVLLDREGPDVKGGLVRCLDGRNVRDIEPTAGGPKRALQLDGADLLQLREIGGAIHGIPVDRRVLHHRPKQEQ